MASDNGGIACTEAEHCFICGIAGDVLYRNRKDCFWQAPGQWQILKCDACRLAWLYPRPVAADIGKLYEGYFTHRESKDYTPVFNFPDLSFVKKIKYAIFRNVFNYDFEIPVKWERLGKLLAFSRFMRELSGYSALFLDGSEKGAMLDLGCGNGRFLLGMKALGWDVHGVEPDPEAASVAGEKLPADAVCCGTLAEAGFPTERFDVITMNHVIEHLPDPVSTLKECYRVLKPGGKLIILAPNLEGLAHRVFGENAMILDVPRHLYTFSLNSMEKSLKMASLEISQVKPTFMQGHVWKASFLLSCGNRGEELLCVNYFEKIVGAVLTYLFVLFNRSLCDELFIVAKKEM